jgi:hypothetical protein
VYARSKITFEQDLRRVEKTADPSTTLRFGRDDKSWVGASLKLDRWLELGPPADFITLGGGPRAHDTYGMTSPGGGSICFR